MKGERRPVNAMSQLAEITEAMFPQRLLGPWQERVARELGDSWRAGMQPHSGRSDDEAVWRLHHDSQADGVAQVWDPRRRVTVSFMLTGKDQDELVKVARRCMEAYL